MKVLALVKQYEVDNEHLTHHGDEMMKIVYGNKHLTFEQLTNAREKQIRANLEVNPQLKLKQRSKLFMWKVQMFKMQQCETFDAILTQGDLEEYYEAEIFEFFKASPEISKPSVFDLLREYLKNIYILKTQVGTTLGWNLPQFKKPLDQNGMPVQVAQDQMYRLKEMELHKSIRKVTEQAEMRSKEPEN